MATDYAENAERFLTEETPFHLGFLPTEQSSPLTRTLEQDFKTSTREGVRTLQRVDHNVLQMARKVLASPQFSSLAEAGEKTIRGGGRIIFSGCGATGRLSILLEAMWKSCCRTHGVEALAGSVESIMTGGDFALVKSVESFEDYAVFGARQVAERQVSAADLLVAITEGGETSSVLGTVAEATRRGARAFLLFNNPADLLVQHLERCREAITNPAVTVLDLSCGPMALAGSTRMQATTSEQLIASAALELIFRRLTGDKEPAPDFAEAFARLLYDLESDAALAGIAEFIDFENGIYQAGGRVTYFADDFMLDIFTDTTERSPTFMLPGFRKNDDTVSPVPWAFVRNPLYSTPEAFRRALEREPRCLEWTPADYRAMGAGRRLEEQPPRIGATELLKFPVGNEPLPERSATGGDAAVLVSYGTPDENLKSAFHQASSAFALAVGLEFGPCRGDGCLVPMLPVPTRMRVFEHLGVKLALNTISTGTMVKFGRVSGNWMSHVAVSNKKLIDRAIRLIAELGGVKYPEACRALFRSMAELETLPPGAERPSAVQYTLRKLRNTAD